MRLIMCRHDKWHLHDFAKGEREGPGRRASPAARIRPRFGSGVAGTGKAVQHHVRKARPVRAEAMRAAPATKVALLDL